MGLKIGRRIKTRSNRARFVMKYYKKFEKDFKIEKIRMIDNTMCVTVEIVNDSLALRNYLKRWGKEEN